MSSPRAAIYTRVSSAAQEAEGTSLQTQEERCRAYAVEHGYQLDEAHVFREVHSGADLAERPRLLALRKQLRAGAINVVIAYAVDRLSRNQTHVGVLFYEVDQADARLEFVTEKFEDSAVGKFVLAARAFVGEVEREKIVERTTRGKRARIASGRLLGTGQALYGYRYTPTRSAYEIDPITGEVVRRIFAASLSGQTLRGIAAGLTADRIPTPRGRTIWSPATVRWILTNPDYTGQASGWKYTVVHDKRAGTSKVVVRPAEERMPLPQGTIPALVDVEAFGEAGAIRTSNQAFAIRNAHDPEAALLRGGYAKCGYCGYTLRVSKEVRKKAGVRLRYRCGHNAQAAGLCPESPTISVDELDGATWERVDRVLRDPDIIAAELARRNGGDDPNTGRMVEIDAAIADIARRERGLVANIPVLTGRAVALANEHLEELGAHRERWEQQRAALLAEQARWDEAQDRLSDIEHWCGRVARRLSTLSWAEKRLALDGLGVVVQVYCPDHDPHYEITASIPLEQAENQPIVKRSSSDSIHNLSLRWTVPAKR